MSVANDKIRNMTEEQIKEFTKRLSLPDENGCVYYENLNGVRRKPCIYGYVRHGINSIMVHAHRVSYWVKTRDVKMFDTDVYCVDHYCKNRMCLEHLRLITYAQNNGGVNEGTPEAHLVYRKVASGEYKNIVRNRLVSIAIEDNGCVVPVKTPESHGYVRIEVKYVKVYCHVLTYIITHPDEIEKILARDYVINHLCRNRACMHPRHLELVTHKENLNY